MQANQWLFASHIWASIIYIAHYEDSEEIMRKGQPSVLQFQFGLLLCMARFLIGPSKAVPSNRGDTSLYRQTWKFQRYMMRITCLINALMHPIIDERHDISPGHNQNDC